MGKIRIKTLGEADKEKKEKQKAKARAETKKTLKVASVGYDEVQRQEKTAIAARADTQVNGENQSSNQPQAAKKQKNKFTKGKQKHSSNYRTALSLVDKNKIYPLDQALMLLPKLKLAKFDETIELHINTVENGISGNVVLPHGTGKQIRIAIANFADNPKQVEDLVKNIESGKIEFDVLIATPESMAKLAKVARVLGPRGLMPNPKSGTVSLKPDEVAKKYLGGQMNFKTEAKFPLLHLSVGKASFGEKKLADNIRAALSAVQMKNIKSVTLKSTMSPGIKLDMVTL